MGDRGGEKRGGKDGAAVVPIRVERKEVSRADLNRILIDWLYGEEVKESLRKFAWEQLFALSAPDASDEDAPFEMPSPEVMADPAALAAFTLTCLGRLHAGNKRKR